MNSAAIKIFFLLVVLFSGATSFFLWKDNSPILIESRESRTVDGKPVFNQIQLLSKEGKDIWSMKQSHQGLSLPLNSWDRLEIVVGTDSNQKEAVFFQLGEDHKPVDFKVSCYLCHSNGPRAIRPNFESKEVPVSLWNQMRLQMWNLKIKTYGRIHGKSGGGNVPFAFKGERFNRPPGLKTCSICHNETGWFARGELKLQHFMPIQFLTKEKQMPPPGFHLSQKETEKLKMMFRE